MNTIEVFNETNENLELEMNSVKTLANNTLLQENVITSECNIIFVSNERIQEINREYRKIDKVTDVISFALEDNMDFEMPIRVLGDIYISIEKTREQAIEYNHSFKRELSFLTVHGILHLLGYDHMNEEDEKIMFKRQEEVLNSYGIIR